MGYTPAAQALRGLSPILQQPDGIGGHTANSCTI
jgi:hypothetical protein